MDDKIITWADLTKEEQSTFGNGCGSGWTKFLVPDLIWGDVCKHHDFNFWRGGLLKRFLKTNLVFFAFCIIHICDRAKTTWQIPLYFIASVIYFLSVMTIGVFIFNWGKQKTHKDFQSLKNVI